MSTPTRKEAHRQTSMIQLRRGKRQAIGMPTPTNTNAQEKETKNMKPTTLPFWPVYPANVIADPKLSRLTPVEFGCFWRLLLHAWLSEGRLPVEESDLRRLCGVVKAAQWRKIWERIAPLFERNTDQTLTHAELKHVYELQLEKHARNSEKASKAAKARYDKHSDKHASSSATSMPIEQSRTDIEVEENEPEWFVSLNEIWEEHTGGMLTTPWDKKTLEALVSKHGVEDVRPSLKAYLRSLDGSKAKPKVADFAANYGSYNGTSRPTSAARTAAILKAEGVRV